VVLGLYLLWLDQSCNHMVWYGMVSGRKSMVWYGIRSIPHHTIPFGALILGHSILSGRKVLSGKKLLSGKECAVRRRILKDTQPTERLHSASETFCFVDVKL
jgi:hypothetical protein